MGLERSVRKAVGGKLRRCGRFIRHHCTVPTTALDRVRSDLAEGRLWKARDRVTGNFAGRPTDPVLLELAGQVFFQMGDLPRAGAYWFLTDKDGPEVEAALVALKERHGNGALGLVHALPVGDAIEAFPPRYNSGSGSSSERPSGTISTTGILSLRGRTRPCPNRSGRMAWLMRYS